jgi:TolB-like protein/tRNA A-37 threonylcarbamoyl transferase component Bud32/Flp pilus assembly protein TadD
MVPLEPGHTLSHYRIVGKLGQGGQATAYRAEDLRLNRPVVVKALRPELAESEPARRRFEREACLCSALEHPNICAIYDVGEEDGLAYIVMQLVEGQTVKELLGGRPLDHLKALAIAVQITDALAVAHASGIVHRDIKPSNVMVTPAGQAKVLDFGLAKMLAGDTEPLPSGSDPMTEIGVPYGSIGYASPEQAAGQAADHRSDVFSVGVLLYEMLTGQPPFKGRNRLELLRAVINETPRGIVQLNPRVPPPLQVMVERAMAKDPADRYQTMAALRDDLKALQRRLTRESEPQTHEAAALPGAVRRPRGAWMLGGTLVRALGRWKPGHAPSTPRAQSAKSPAFKAPSSWGTETRPTLAVLPFRNLAQDPEAAFYEFSLADGVITELGQLRSLVVRPSSYVAPFVGHDVDPRLVGEELKAGLVLTGGFVKAGDRFRVNVQVLSAASGEIQWSEKIDVAAADLITIQDTIAARVIAGLRLGVSPEEQARIEQLPTRSNEAYEFYLRGRDRLFRYIFSTFDEVDLEAALQMFNEAVGLDAGFAAAHAALGRCYVHHAQGYGGPEYYTLAERALRRALELDPALSEARLQMVYVDLHNGDKERAEATIHELRRDTPEDPAVLFVSALLYRIDGLYARALDEYDRLLAVNPEARVIVAYNRARIFRYLHENDQALAELELARSLEPDHPLVKTFLAIAYFDDGRVDAAQALVEDVLRQNPHFDGLQPVLGWCLSARGDHAGARALITDRVRETAEADYDIALWLASLYAMEGLVDEGIEWARRAASLGNQNYPLFATSHKLDGLRQDSRFGELLSELRRIWETRRSEDLDDRTDTQERRGGAA